MLCDTQWRVGMGGRTGLDYLACKTVLNDERRKFAKLGGVRQAFRDLRVIESAKLRADYERQEAEKARKENVE